MGKRIKTFLFCFFFLFILAIISAQENATARLNEKEEAALCLNNSELIMQRLKTEGFSIERVNDSLKEAKLLFIVQEEIEKKGLKTDYKKILSYCEEIKRIEEMAHATKDQIIALENFFKKYGEGIQSEKINSLFDQIYKEMKNERYELVPELIEKTYSAINEEQAKKALIVVYYSATTKGLIKEWKKIVISIILIVVLIIVFNKPIRRHLIRKKIDYLKKRRKKLKEMIAQNQDAYFNKGKISQMDFEIKNKKLAEIVRDINRQIPLLEEELKKT